MRTRTLAAIAFAISWASIPGLAETERPLSPAQTALFATDHLHTIRAPTIIRYSFAASGSAGGFADRVAIGIDPRPDGTKDVNIDFLSGERHMPFQPVSGFKGNPVLMFFLERDVLEMRKVTGGSALYFRNRIRDAFLTRATVRPANVAVDGKELGATEVTLVPFRDDPMIARFPAFREKSYRFVLVDTVPGSVYQIATFVPEEGALETLTFVGSEPCWENSGCVP